MLSRLDFGGQLVHSHASKKRVSCPIFLNFVQRFKYSQSNEEKLTTGSYLSIQNNQHQSYGE